MLKALTTILLVAGLYFGWNTVQGDRALPVCTEPIAYSVGSFDRRFGISYRDFLSVVSEAEEIWESAAGKELFSHAPASARLRINLVYDYRQEVTEELGAIESMVEEGEEAYSALEREYDIAQRSRSQLESAYDARVALFSQHNAIYESHVEAWNRSDRTSRATFESLEIERQALERELAEVKLLEEELNRSVEAVNLLVERLNRLAKELSLNVEEYNTIGASRGETFAGGIYSSGAGGEKIDIYEFKTRQKLLRVLAHELGHALGLEHVEDSEAIMYRLNVGDKDELSSADVEALKTLCATN